MGQTELIAEVCNEVKDLVIRKNHYYGDSLSKEYEKYGLISGVIRMDDKMAIIKILLKSDSKVDESIEDSLKDLAGYAILTLVEMRKRK